MLDLPKRLFLTVLPLASGFGGARSSSCLRLQLCGPLIAACLVNPGVPAYSASGPDAITTLIRSGHYADAEHAARDSVAANERVYGPDSRELASSIDQLVNTLRLTGKSGEREALDLANRAVAIKEKSLGPDDAQTATSLASRGAVFLERGDYKAARTDLIRAVEIRRRVLGPGRPEVARVLRFIAELEQHEGNSKAAIADAQEALAIMSNALPANDPEIANSLSAVAGYLYDSGDYSEAGTYYERALASFLKAYGPHHPMVATCHHNLGTVYTELQDNEEGRYHFECALAIRRKALGPDHPLVASTLMNLAWVLQNMGYPVSSVRPKYVEALRILEKAYSGGHPDIGWTLMRLGRLDTDRHAYNTASAELKRALDIQIRTLGETHPDVAWTYSALGGLEEAEHDTSEARRSYARAIAIIESAYGPIHPDRIRFLNEFARFSARASDSTRALNLALQSADARAEQLRVVSRGLAERQALAYTSFGTTGLDLAMLLAAHGVGGSEAPRRVWDSVIRSRALVLDEMAARQRLRAKANEDTSLANAFRAVEDARENYAGLLVRGNSDIDRQSLMARRREDLDRAEQDFAARSREFRLDEERSRIGWKQVSDALSSGTALLGFALCRASHVATYEAFVATNWQEPHIVNLGRSDSIDSLIWHWTEAIARGPLTDRGQDAMKAEVTCREAGDRLRRRIWDPLTRYIGKASSVCIVPDGELYRVNFPALPIGKRDYLIDSGPLIKTLTCERDLGSPKQASHGVGLLAIGGPAFDHLYPSQDPRQADGHSKTSGRRGVQEPDCADFTRARFDPLPESVGEVRDIALKWPDKNSIVLLTAAEATESRFKLDAPGKRVLHLATHGFFIDQSRCVVIAGRRGIGGLSKATGSPPKRPTKRTLTTDVNPLLLSGLALAGANRRAQASEVGNDGILTAQEVASLDLSGVDWAVLSACDTGLGHVEVGEGVLGLQRAFRIAGVRTVIMSLWAVPDAPTRRWMDALYDARLNSGLTTAEAVREASRDLLREQRAQSRSTNPLFWAGFVAAGDDN